MLKRYLSLFFSGLLCVALLGHVAIVQAQAPAAIISLPFNAATDGVALQPSDRLTSDQPYDASRVIIGNDERSPVLSRAYPWSAIGRLDWVDSSGRILGSCTGTLISRDLILTNSHCIIDESTDRPTSNQLVFKPSMIRGVALDEAKVISYDYGWKSGSRDSADDWAVMKLDQPLGDAYGYLGWRNLDFSDPTALSTVQEKIKLAGYSADFPTGRLREFGIAGDTAGVDLACSILEASQGILFHDCDTNPGASGSAIFAEFNDGKYYVLGLHARSVPLNRTFTLPDGVTTDRVNGGVEVSQWATQALAMQR